jgi:hypothetical protein
MTNASLLPVEARKPSNALHRIRTDTAVGNAGPPLFGVRPLAGLRIASILRSIRT